MAEGSALENERIVFCADNPKILAFALKARFFQIRQTKEKGSLIYTVLVKGFPDQSFLVSRKSEVSGCGFNGT